jgi:hypothetical protein
MKNLSPLVAIKGKDKTEVTSRATDAFYLVNTN